MNHRPCEFRVSLAALIAGTTGLGVLTAIRPDGMMVAFLTVMFIIALPFAVAIDILVAAEKGHLVLQFSLRQVLIVTACIAVYLSLLREPWTFRARFAVSRSALERLAAEVEGGVEVAPQWTGLFFIKKAKRNGIFTILWTDPDGGSPAGFVHPASDNGLSHNDGSIALRHDAQWNYFIQD
ncbi:MAG TPA: hypothetical protein VF278_08160 [Pirellulales bacterium]